MLNSVVSSLVGTTFLLLLASSTIPKGFHGSEMSEDVGFPAILLDVPGCTYVWACNYNPDADVDDGSCVFPPVGCPWPSNSAVVGCTYFDALNYSPVALYDDGSCAWSDQISGCPVDVNGDGVVAVQDILLVLGSFGMPCVEPVANMLLIGNSFFKPYAQHLESVSEQAGLTQYQVCSSHEAATMAGPSISGTTRRPRRTTRSSGTRSGQHRDVRYDAGPRAGQPHRRACGMD